MLLNRSTPNGCTSSTGRFGMTAEQVKGCWSWPGSWPHEANRQPREVLMNLSSDELRAMIRDNFRSQWEATKGRIKYLSPGDPGEWSVWIMMPALYRVRPRLGLPHTEIEGYADMLRRPRSAAHITANDIGQLGYAYLYRIAYEEFLKFREEQGATHLKLRVGLASPFDWGMLVNCYAVGLDGFTEALVREIKEILSFASTQDLLLSWESPFGQIATAMTRVFGLGGVVARYCARILQDVLQRLPNDVQIGLHPCWGDYDNNSLIEGLFTWAAQKLGLKSPHKFVMWLARVLQSPKAIAIFVNPLQEVAGERLKEVLLCLAAGTAEPSDLPRRYRGMRKLKQLAWVTYVAGFCHRSLSKKKALAVRRAAVWGSGIRFTHFGSTCGLARMSEEDARHVVGIGCYLCEHPLDAAA
ncbi:MAG TPA: hypothetical protein VFZ48_04995 [Candidatus Saccharimonadales bacterium]